MPRGSREKRGKTSGGWDGMGRRGRGAGINGPADKIISEAMLKKGSLAAPRAIHSPLSLLSPGPRKSKTTPARNGSSLSLSLSGN